MTTHTEDAEALAHLQEDIGAVKDQIRTLTKDVEHHATPPESAAPTKKDFIKYAGVIATMVGIILPLVAGYFQYRQSVQQDLDNSFRAIVVDLSSKNREQRIAAATNMGTFIKKGEKYYEQSIDILVNRLSTELDYNVVHAIRNSLEKVDEQDYKLVMTKLLRIERVNYIQEHELRTRMKIADQKVREIETLLGSSDTESVQPLDAASAASLREELKKRYETYYVETNALDDLKSLKQVISDFISMFLTRTESIPLIGVQFFRNSLSGVNLLNLNFGGIEFNRSALSRSNIINSNFDKSEFYSTVFTFSDLTDSTFRNCDISFSFFDQAILKDVDFSGTTFDEVYFAGADLTDTNFKNAKGLKPIYFFKAKNIEKAHFDSGFKVQLDEALSKISVDDYKDYVEQKSKLSSLRKKELFTTLEEIKNSNEKHAGI